MLCNMPCPRHLSRSTAQVWVPTNAKLMQLLQVELLLDVQQAKEQLQDDDTEGGASEVSDDPAGYQAFDAAARFLTDFAKGLPGGGDKGKDSIVPNR